MQDYTPGQRWISDAELQMGLGTVLSSDQRTVTIHFLASGENRMYSRQTAPLTRVRFAIGDEAHSHEGWSMTVTGIEERNGLLTYTGTRSDGSAATLEEGQLDSFIQLNRPGQRLFNGQIDKDRWFELRYQTHRQQEILAQSDLRGITGARTSLIPHQLYIAHEVASRYAPRVLLADEVGLGKTIEAGLILHQQLHTGKAKRTLIVVPASLVHQWLVEMLRRFNLAFSVFDEERCHAIEESNDIGNPFHNEQLVLCQLEFLRDNPERLQQALDGEWDLLIVDEAHHLQWSPQAPSIEYRLVEQLAANTAGVLLLTATPEQLGRESHFARLRLLDPDRFPDFDSFMAEEALYEPVALAIEELLGDKPIDEQTRQVLAEAIQEEDNLCLLDSLTDSNSNKQEHDQARTELVEHLLDRHGTGRVLFRNTRSAVKGFPQRQPRGYPLPLPEPYRECLDLFQNTGIADARLLLSPELLYQATEAAEPWTSLDPRIDWLDSKLKELRPDKVLVITASADTALDIAEALRIKSGTHAAVFHEGQDIIERDRAAAYFADPDYGTQLLVCSEIGSEGRNFQFAHHLVLFDLPLNPDLLEQRIGRLDRIGQTRTINIHVPYLDNSAQAIMYHWYHEGLDALAQTCPAGHNVFVQVETTLLEALHQLDTGLEDLSALVSTTQQLHGQLKSAMQKGRDRLLEYNSCRPDIALQLKQRALQQDEESELLPFLEKLFDCYGVDMEDHSRNIYIIRPGEQMQGHSFPGLYNEGMSITCDRDTALTNEDVHFITWEHPLVTGAVDMVLSNELGNTALTAIKYRGLPPGKLLLECLFCLEAPSEQVQNGNWLPPAMIRIVIDQQGRDHAAAVTPEHIRQTQELVDADTAGKLIKATTADLRSMQTLAEKQALQQAPAILTRAHEHTQETLMREINRLKALQGINPNIREEEITFFEQRYQALTSALQAARPRLDAMRVMIVTGQ